MRVMFVVTHLLGTGHLSRIAALAQTFHSAGHKVLIVSGGLPAPHLQPPGIDFVQLPPLRSDGIDFTRLLDGYGQVATETYLGVRSGQLLSANDNFCPDILVTELFPFGRRSLRAEFTALLEHKHRQTKALSSIRDILAPPTKPEKAAFAKRLIQAYYAAVLVHGDEDVTPLSLSWPVDEDLSPYLHYTGFVAKKPMSVGKVRAGILVSTGGGSVGNRVFKASLDAARKLAHIDWRLVVGGPNERRQDLIDTAPPNVCVEPLRTDFRELLASSCASVSLTGYNTVQDLLQSGTPSIVIPFDDGDELEQSIRANALSNLSAFSVIKQSELNGERLAKALTKVMKAGPRAPMRDNMTGATNTLRFCENLAEIAS